MPDVFTKRKRSDVMSRIRGAGNKATELRLIQIFRANGITGWRRGCSLALAPRSAKGQVASAKSLVRDPSGLRFQVSGLKTAVRSTGRVKPDFVFPKQRTAVFVDGCFWHGCPRHGTKPKTRAAFWLAKLTGNKARDRRVNRLLRAKGWKVIRVWEHELRRKDEAKLLRRLRKMLFASFRGQPRPSAQAPSPRIGAR
jgi:DNA mismatch endonuclease (patch repair protein)